MQSDLGKNVRIGGTWTHPSVLALGGDSDPFKSVTARAREVVLKALESGWSGPPYDPFRLAELLRIGLQPSQGVVDARTIPVGTDGFRIEFNPNRPRPRVNYSIAHEIAHTLFPDCARAIRNRYTHAELKADDWQLEMLCNVAASEFLMPIGSFSLDEAGGASIEKILEWRNQYCVSTEAVLLRYVKLTSHPCSIFTSHREESGASGRYVIDYAVPSRTWRTAVRTGYLLPSGTAAAECTGIGFTAKAEETWMSSEGRFRLECLGVPPYPGQTYPRVMGILTPKTGTSGGLVQVNYLVGDATRPRGHGKRIIAQLVNDKALSWGKGFTVAVRRKWPGAQKAFTDWALAKTDFRLGNVHYVKLDEHLELASLVAQHGYGPAPGLRLRYSALENCLENLAQHARKTEATVHMPRIGSGEAGGNWEIVSEIVDETLCRNGISATVYDLPGADRSKMEGSAWLFGKPA